MSKAQKRYSKQRTQKYEIHRSVQSLIPIDAIWEDGIFKSGNFYSKCYRFADINYKVASDKDKQGMLDRYATYVLNGIDNNAIAQIGAFHHRPTKWDALARVGIPLTGDENDRLREECNRIISGESGQRTCYVDDKYMTISSYRRNYADAVNYFKRIDREMEKAFGLIGSVCSPMSTEERILLLHNFYRPGESNHFDFNIKKRKKRKSALRDYICPDGIRRHSDHLEVGNRFVRVLFLKDIANYVDDDFMDNLLNRNQDVLCSVNILPVPKNEGVHDAEMRYMGLMANEHRYIQRQNAHGNYSQTTPYHMQMQQEESLKHLKKLKDDDQREFKAMISLVVTADSKSELDQETEDIRAYAIGQNCQMDIMRFEQINGLNATLPIGHWMTHAFRTFTSGSLAAFHLFKVPDILESNGIYFGVNKVSGNPILCNKENRINAGAVIIGKSGSGKSVTSKHQIITTYLSTGDQIMIFDPEGEYWPIIKAMCGNDATIIHLSAGGKDYLNPLYMVDGYSDGNSISAKSEFIMSLVNRMDDQKLSGHDKSVIDRCLAAIYADGKRDGTTPTLSTLRKKLLEQPEQVAKDVALTLELFTSGSFDIFGHESNVDLSKRVIVFNTHGLGENLKAASLLVITDTILNRTTLNWRQGKRTHIFLDEFHTVFDDEFSTKFFASVWMQFRKRNGFPTAITQNVTYLLRSPEARVMVANSEIITMLSQSEEDQAVLMDLLKLSNEQLSYIQNAEPGCGLIKYGGLLVPFDNQIPKDSELYALMTTRPGEGVFAGGQA